MDMVGDVVPSVVRVGTAEGEIAVAVHGGFFQVGPGEAEGETLMTNFRRHRRKSGRDRRGASPSREGVSRSRDRRR